MSKYGYFYNWGEKRPYKLYPGRSAGGYEMKGTIYKIFVTSTTGQGVFYFYSESALKNFIRLIKRKKNFVRYTVA